MLFLIMGSTGVRICSHPCWLEKGFLFIFFSLPCKTTISLLPAHFFSPHILSQAGFLLFSSLVKVDFGPIDIRLISGQS